MQANYGPTSSSVVLTDEFIDRLRALNPTAQLLLKRYIRDKRSIRAGELGPVNWVLYKISTSVQDVEEWFRAVSSNSVGDTSYKLCFDDEMTDQELAAEVRRLLWVLDARESAARRGKAGQANLRPHDR